MEVNFLGKARRPLGALPMVSRLYFHQGRQLSGIVTPAVTWLTSAEKVRDAAEATVSVTAIRPTPGMVTEVVPAAFPASALVLLL